MFEEIKKILSEEYGITELSMSTNFKKDLGLSSFDFMNLICIVEDRYQVELDEEKYRSLTTIEDLTNYLEVLIS
ncbi:MAG: hypothetical protein IJ079_05985 [Lachnospiraceae bacterium]|nr:hypothetical protein [Lachnospiraceae bacterium]